jgi:hypothetical protein
LETLYKREIYIGWPESDLPIAKGLERLPLLVIYCHHSIVKGTVFVKLKSESAPLEGMARIFAPLVKFMLPLLKGVYEGEAEEASGWADAASHHPPPPGD